MNEFFVLLNKAELARGSLETTKFVEDACRLYPEKAKYYFNLLFGDENFNFSVRSLEKALDVKNTFEDIGKFAEYHSCGQNNIDLTGLKELVYHILPLKGNNLIIELKRLTQILSKNDSKWIFRALTHSSRGGVSLNVVNKCFNNLGVDTIEKFKVQLCKTFKTVEDVDWTFPFYAAIKYDGMRAIIEKKGDTIKITSRNGEDVNYVPEIVDEIKKFDFDLTIDGEIDCDDFNRVSCRIGRKPENIEYDETLHFSVFDILSLRGDDCTQKPQLTRTETLNNLFDESKHLKHEKNWLIKSKEQLQIIFDRVISVGEEGLILKKLDGKYDVKKRENWAKLKPRKEMTLEVFNFSTGNGKFKDTISRLEVKDSTGKLTSWVGSGISNADIEVIAKLNLDNKLYGTKVDIIFQDVEKSKTGKISLRFPRFSKFRFDKDIADNADFGGRYV